MSLNDTQLKIIAENPLNDTLAGVRAKLQHSDDPLHENTVATLLGALVSSSAALDLLLLDGSSDVAEKLFAIRRKVRGGTLGLEKFRPILDAVIANSTDPELWTAVLQLIDAVNPSTPPQSSIIPTRFGTPVKTSSSRLEDSEKSEIIERELFYEIKDCTHRSVPGFFTKHFDSTNWDKKRQQMLKLILDKHEGKKWKNFPADPWETDVWHWLTVLEETALAGASYKLHQNKSANEFKQRKGQMDIFFQKPQRTGGQFEYKHVLVVGEQKRTLNRGDFKACMLQLTRHVRSIFADQPMRRFVHAFTIKGTTMELWVFDRSGAYSSGEFDIHCEPEKLACALVAYATMDDEAMGLDQSIEWKEKHRYITVEGANGKDKRVELNQLLVRQRAVVCRGTTCFATKHGVAKFSWRSAKRQPSEVNHLKTVREKGVEGVAELVGHRDIISIANLRTGLEFSKQTRHLFKAITHDRSDGYNRSTSDTSGSSRKRKSIGDDARPSSRRRSNSQKSALQQAYADQMSKKSNGNAKPSLYAADQEDPYENRILSCLVISPAGRVISDFQTVRELLEALRDAIRAHQSLFVKGRILHRDISSNNIIITDGKKSGGFRGMLIDLDLAKERDGEPTGARHQTGTMQFMAIEVLRGTDHTYRHDLESFFYVLLWMCARNAWDKENIRKHDEEAPAESILRKWEIGNFKDIASAKMGHMTVNSLEDIMDEFPEALEAVKPLCLQIRSILFGDTARMVLGTPSVEPAQLYDSIIEAYNESLQHLYQI